MDKDERSASLDTQKTAKVALITHDLSITRWAHV
eukprot:CAMPEP_0184396844 /NCGR_PEP_ID=MMETSP0007-20130409/55758_1 /TAXON_ID=97485 /ORGANISM="Prymnesium parvum, Strain Texoma1" /LENGTH=33 /DNA_ID= /DNA_START= /DNA_END= /DNA_ORIENTATION=